MWLQVDYHFSTSATGPRKQLSVVGGLAAMNGRMMSIDAWSLSLKSTLLHQRKTGSCKSRGDSVAAESFLLLQNCLPFFVAAVVAPNIWSCKTRDSYAVWKSISLLENYLPFSVASKVKWPLQECAFAASDLRFQRRRDTRNNTQAPQHFTKRRHGTLWPSTAICQGIGFWSL